MDCLSASGNAISDASDLSRAGMDVVLLNQPNGAGRRAHEGPASNYRAALSACSELLPRSFVDGLCSVLSVWKKLSIGALSKQSALRLIEAHDGGQT